jgi:uncharacterized Zn-binding protein involved in type VI secretion
MPTPTYIAGVNQDIAGGKVTATATKLTVGGIPVLRVTDAVESHGLGAHAAAVMAVGSSALMVEGLFVCRMGNIASCGDAVIGSGAKLKLS